jgi:hypothetical protein
MSRFKVVMMICCLSFVSLALSNAAKADEWNKKTTVTFSGPVEIPGVGAQTLPAGTYVFKLMDSASDRNIVQIFSADETHVYSTILAIPNYRLKPTDKTVITFKERAEGQPEAIRAWFYPGEQWGQEFAYPKSRAVELAKLTNEPVLEMTLEPAANVAPIEALKALPIRAVEPSGEEVEVAEVVEAPPALTPTPRSLPQTASQLPLLGLIGMLSLGAGYTLVLISKRAA